MVVRQPRPNRQKLTLNDCDVLCRLYCRYGQAQAPGPWQPQPGYQAPPPVTPKVGASSGTLLFFYSYVLQRIIKSSSSCLIFRVRVVLKKVLLVSDVLIT